MGGVKKKRRRKREASLQRCDQVSESCAPTIRKFCLVGRKKRPRKDAASTRLLREIKISYAEEKNKRNKTHKVWTSHFSNLWRIVAADAAKLLRLYLI